MTDTTLPKQRSSFRIKFEPRIEEPPKWYPVAVSVGAFIVALIIGGIVISFAGGNPFASYAHIARASFGNIGVLSDTIVKATPIMLTALACSVAFRMKLWNIGAEGQFIMGAWGASAIVLAIFIPLIISSGGNSGSQAATLVTRAMALGEVSVADWWGSMLCLS